MKNLSDSIKHTTNPFIENMANNHVQTKKKSELIGSRHTEYASVETGEIEGGRQIHTIYKDVDPEAFAKIYLNKMKEVFNLPIQSYKVLGYILNNVKPNKAEFYIYPHLVMAYAKWKSKRSVYTGLSGLINSDIIANSVIPSLYYINPTYVFNGDRFICIQEWRKTQTLNLEVFGDIINEQKLVVINEQK